MFDLSDETLTRVKKNQTPEDRLEIDTAEETKSPENPLDSDTSIELHSRLINFYRMELDKQASNRFEQACDEDYYDNIQWTDDEIADLKARGQAPTVYNVIAQSINWIIGSEKRGRTDFKILPRGKEDAKPAEAKTKYMKYLSDTNKTPFHRSRAFEDAAKVGIGWLEEGVQDEDDGEPIYCRYESWRNMIHDSSSTELDGSDSRYMFRAKWVDEDVAIALFPERAAFIRQASTENSFLGAVESIDGDLAMDMPEMQEEGAMHNTVVNYKRRRVRLIEAWYRTPEKVERLRGGAFNGQIYDEQDPRHVEDIQAGQSVLVSKVMMRVRCCIMTTGALLYEGPSPYRHNRFKFIPIWCYRRGRDNMPYGYIRGMRSIQDGVNKRASKALYILSTNKVIADEGFLPEGVTIEQFADEVAQPDSILIKRKGYEMTLNADTALAAPHLDMMSRDIQMIQQVGGVTDELLGRTTNAVSGVAVEARQEQGSLATNKIFDNLRLAEQMRGEIELSLIEQFATEQKQFRITNQRGTPEYISVNDGLPENDITRSKADFVISEAEWRATLRQTAMAELTEMVIKMPPEVGLAMLDLIAENYDVQNRDEIVKRIRAINGQRDPDATELTPEEQQRMQAQAKQQAAQEEMFMAQLRKLVSEALKNEATADKTKAETIDTKMTATQTAMGAATQVVQMPTIAAVADNLLQEAGWTGYSPAIQGLPQPVQQQPAPPPGPAAPPAPNGMVSPPQPPGA